MTETNFTIQWLEERFAFDSAARNQAVEQACIQAFEDKTQISLLDIGSGTGASCIYFMEKWDISQNWTLIELNAALAAASLVRIGNYAQQNGYILQEGEQQLFLQKGSKFITIQVETKSFFELDNFIDWGSIDLMTATAVFDLLTSSMFEAFIAPLEAYHIPLLATINYEDMKLLPADNKNVHYTDLYTAHMQRPQTFGVTMGGDTTKEIKSILQRKNIRFHIGKSNWSISPTDTNMIEYLLNYMNDAIPDLLTDISEQSTFKNWVAVKKQQKNLSIEVKHWDFFMYF